MTLKKLNSIGILLIIPFILISCEDFVEVEAPDNKLVQDVVFSSDATAKSAMTGIYNQLFLAAFANGQRSSVTLLSGLSADNIRNIYTTNITRVQFEQNELLQTNSSNLDIWSSAYNMIYMTNALLEGVDNSEKITPDVKKQLEGEARFIRAFTYFYLVNLYGDVPMVLTTNYRDNQLATRSPIAEVYTQVINDLQMAMELLSPDYLDGERTQVNKYAATALLARVHLFLEDWNQAETLSSQVISETSSYELLNELDNVFLANSEEAIWQISPIGGGGLMTNTNDGNIFIIDPVFSFFAGFQLEDEFVTIFEENDRRLSNWIGYNEGKDAFFAHKYKVWNSNTFPIEEYSMVLRLAEQFLIRAEARAKKGDITGAIEDLDAIRKRAGSALLSEINPGISQEELLKEIFEERRKELFTEWGHRWLDLKRTGRTSEILGSNNQLWEPTDELYPIPAEERMKNPNLSQNTGY
jgi:hypothetical protein